MLLRESQIIVMNQSPVVLGAVQTTTSDPHMTENMKLTGFCFGFFLDKQTPTKQLNERHEV